MATLRRARLGLLVVALGSGGCGGPPGPRDPAADLPAAGRGLPLLTLATGLRADGGLRILVVPDPAVDQVELAVRIPTGSAADPPGKEGLAHLVEHLVFHAQVAPAGPTLEQRLAAVSASFNATTRADATHYLATATVDDAAQVADALADVAAGVRCAQLDRAALDLERAIVEAERRLRQTRDQERLSAALTEVGYPAGHPYRGGLASATSLAAITWDDVCRFLEEHYRPERAFAVLTGPLSDDQLLAATAPFDRVVAGPPPPSAPVAPAEVARAPVEVAVAADVDRLFLIWPAPARHDEDGLLARIVATRLDSELARERQAGRLGAYALGFAGGLRAPLLVLSVELDGADAAEVRATVGAALGRLWRERVDDQAFYLRAVAIHQLYREVAAFDGRTSTWADYLQHDVSMGLFTSDLERLGGITPARLEQLTAEGFAIERAGVVIARARADQDGGDATTVGTPRAEPRVVAPPPTAVPAVPVERRRVTSMTLPGGLTVVMAPSGHVPLVTARLVVPAGTRDDALGGEAWLAALTLHAPTAERGRYRDAVTLIGSHLASLDIEVGATTTSFTATALTPFQDHLVWGLARLVGDGVTDDDDLARLIARRQARPRDPGQAARAAARTAAIYGDASAVGPAPTPAALGRHRAESIDDWRTSHYPRSGAVLVLTGDFSWSLMERHLPVAFADWTLGPAPPPLPRATRSSWVTFERDDPQVSLELRLPVAVPDAATEAQVRLAAAFLDEQIAAVRARLGAAYVLDARLDDDPEAPALVLRGEIDGARAGEAAAIVARAVAELRAGRGDPTLLRRAQARAARTLHARLGGLDHFAADVVGWSRRGLSTGHGAAVAAALAALPSSELAAAAAAAVGPHTIGIVAGRRAAVAATLAAFGATADVALGADDPP